MINQKLRDFLDSNSVKYEVGVHEPTTDASRTAQAAHVPGREFAKTVIVKADGKLFMAVLPSTDQVHLEQLKQPGNWTWRTRANSTPPFPIAKPAPCHPSAISTTWTCLSASTCARMTTLSSMPATTAT